MLQGRKFPQERNMTQGHDAPRLLQVFNQYLEAGGEELWVNRLMGLSNGSFTIDDLRFHSHDWVQRRAPARPTQVKMLWNNPASRHRLRDEVKKVSPDVLIYHNLIPVASLGMYDEAQELGLPVIQYVHNFRPFSPTGTLWAGGQVEDAALFGNPWPEVFRLPQHHGFLKTLVLAVLQSSLLKSGSLDVVKRWIAVSDFIKDRFIKGGIPADRVVTLRHCWELKEAPESKPEGDHYLFLGRLVREKGTRTLIEAWRILEDNLGDACPTLVIAGTGPDEATLHKLSDRLRKVVCIGYVSGRLKSELLSTCRAVLAPSLWWEPLGLIVHEAYSMERPVLAASSGGLTETVNSGVTGYLHAPGDAEGLAKDVMKLEEAGREGRREMGKTGRLWLEKHANPEEWRKGFLGIVNDAIQEGGK